MQRVAALYLLAFSASAQFFPTMPKEEAKKAAQSTASASGAREFEVRDWVDTGINLNPGDLIRIKATGTIRYVGGTDLSPDGGQKGWKDLLRTFPLNDAGRGALIGRIGDTPTSRPFLIGVERESRAPVTGRLWLGINQPKGEVGEGGFRAAVEITGGVARAKIDPAKLPKLTQAQLDSIPSRVVDAAGTQGDRVNFIIIGPEQKVVGALKSAGWITVNRTNSDAVVGALLSVLNRQGYVELPMSELMMFDRAQDYGFAMGDPIQVIMARHHFRLWRAPFTADGQQVWVGAGTHDIGFDKDQRNNGVTHKIDSNTDLEREFITASLKSTGEVATTSFMTHKNPVKTAKTAHGQEFYSDGRTAVIVMNPDGSDQSSTFSSVFCSVLRDKNPDGGDWGDCAQWFSPIEPSSNPVSLEGLPNKYRVLIVPGLMNTCFRGAPPYKEGQEYLKKAYGISVEMLPLPNDSVEANAAKLGEYLRGKMKEDPRKYIVIGYSKGAPDFQVALVKEAGVKEATAAFISVAGAVGGSVIADSVPDMADQWVNRYSLPGCEGNLAEGFKSIGVKARRLFLTSYPHPPVPAYSIAAISNAENTSAMLKQTKPLLDSVSRKNDSQLTEGDQIVPESKFLGTALADHFAVALPFETSTESIKSQIDKNHYPRSALLEAIIRFVAKDLGQ